MNTDLLWYGAVMVTIGLLGYCYQQVSAWRASKDAQNHPAIARLADLFLQISGSAMAMLKANPQLSPHDAVEWMKAEAKASAPDLITEVGKDATDAGMTYLARRQLVTTAAASTLTDVADKVITTLAPSASTARVSPAQVASVAAAVTSAAPLAMADIENNLLTKYPGLAGLLTSPADNPASPPPGVLARAQTTQAAQAQPADANAASATS